MASRGDEALAAVAELRRLVLHEQFGAAERLLTTLHGIGSPTTIDTLRQLCVSGTEQLRIASELDSAARAQRLLAQEVQQGIEALLASWERHLRMDQEQAPALSASLAQRGDGGYRRHRRRWWNLGAGFAGPGANAGTGLAGAGTASLFHPPISRLPRVGSQGEGEEDSAIGVSPEPAADVVIPDAEVTAYALQHQQQLVSRQYQICSAALRDELGVSPGADTVELFRSLTTHA